MYKFSTRGQYALLIMEDLARSDPEKYIPLKILSHRRNLSVKYLEHILIVLCKKGYVVGSRGNNGGYKLSRPAENYTVGEILQAMEGNISPYLALENNAIISEGSKIFWRNFEKVVNDYVQSITLKDLVQESTNFIGYEYCI